MARTGEATRRPQCRSTGQAPRLAVQLRTYRPPEHLLPKDDQVDVADLSEAISPVEHRVFAGKIDKTKLGYAERAITAALRAPSGDFRDWAAIDAFAGEIAQHVKTGATPDESDRSS